MNVNVTEKQNADETDSFDEIKILLRDLFKSCLKLKGRTVALQDSIISNMNSHLISDQKTLDSINCQSKTEDSL